MSSSLGVDVGKRVVGEKEGSTVGLQVGPSVTPFVGLLVAAMLFAMLAVLDSVLVLATVDVVVMGGAIAGVARVETSWTGIDVPLPLKNNWKKFDTKPKSRWDRSWVDW